MAPHKPHLCACVCVWHTPLGLPVHAVRRFCWHKILRIIRKLWQLLRSSAGIILLQHLRCSCCLCCSAAAVALVWKSMSVAARQQKRDSHSHRHIDSSSQSSRGRGVARQAWLAHQLVWHKATAKAVGVCVCGGCTCLAFLGYPNLALPRPRPPLFACHFECKLCEVSSSLYYSFSPFISVSSLALTLSLSLSLYSLCAA